MHSWRRSGVTVTVATVAWFGVALQLFLSLQLAHQRGFSLATGLIAYLGYFTVLTNLLVALSLTLAARGTRGALASASRSSSVATGVLTSILLVGAGYHLLLREIWNPQGLAWVADGVLHYLTPLLCALNWWFCVPTVRLAWSAPLAWSVWPISYTAYALIRGHLLGHYPYPFIDAAALGYGQVLLNVLGLLVVFVLLGVALVAVMRKRAGHARPDAALR